MDGLGAFFMLIRMWAGRFAFTHFRRKGQIIYLRTLQAVRRSLLAAILFICCLQLIVIGFVGTFVAGVLLTNEEPTVKLWILLAGFLTVLLLPIFGLTFLLSERTWYRYSGVSLNRNDP
jgi:hypothetical protein